MNRITNVLLLLVLLACQKEPKQSLAVTEPLEKQEIETKTPKAQLSVANETAKYIAGIPSSLFAKQQKTDSYILHQKTIQQAWQHSEQTMLAPINKWITANKITQASDTLTVFYPFSGPDFLFVHAFFPYANNYILVGLEKIGTLPNIQQLSTETCDIYLSNLRHSLRFINDKGYFVTKQMEADLANKNLNGTLHLILFYLAQTKQEIIEIENIAIGSDGKISSKKQATEQIQALEGIRIQFRKEGTSKIQQVYYFAINVANNKLKAQPNFMRFLSQQSRQNCYIKSGSYILHQPEFSTIRKQILTQSDKILQDDTGVPYEFLAQNHFQIQLFGHYTKTLKIFKTRFQYGLKEALDAQASPRPLPFSIGYNAWYDETVLIFAQPDTSSLPKTNRVHNQLVFKVQFKTSSHKLPAHSSLFDGLPKVDYYFVDGVYKYTIGNKTNEKQCIALKQLAQRKGFTDAFVVAFYGNKRIPIGEARKRKDF